MANAMIFHYPAPLEPNGYMASQLRPVRMQQAFKLAGFEVVTVCGFARQRRKSIEKIAEQIDKGKSFAFLYSESLTRATLLSEPHRLPLHPLLDFSLMRKLRRHGAKIGLFYRDLHWRFDFFSKESWYKRAVAIPLNHYDWWQYRRVLDHLFLPALDMARYLPVPWSRKAMSALPPGTALAPEYFPSPSDTQANRAVLNLFYVGHVTPPVYDLRPLFEVVGEIETVRLTLCCPESEWLQVRALYQPFSERRIQVVHVAGEQLGKYYREADLFVLHRKPHAYLEFAVPYKVFEAMAYGLPILTTAGTQIAHFVEAEGIGLTISSDDELRRTLIHFSQEREKLKKLQVKVKEVRLRHTWLERARQVAEILCLPNGGGNTLKMEQGAN